MKGQRLLLLIPTVVLLLCERVHSFSLLGFGITGKETRLGSNPLQPRSCGLLSTTGTAFQTGSRSVPTLPGQRHQGSGVIEMSSSGAADSGEAMTIDEWFQKNGIKASSQSLGGSSWAQNYKYTSSSDGKEYFVKTSRQSADKMFAGEALGLKAMYETKACRIPEVLHWGNDGRGGSYIIMEFLPLGGRGSQKELGRAIAKMHLAAPTSCEEAAQGKFGFPVDNTIGGTSQPNKWEDDWPTFFREQRIGHQVRLAGDGQLQSLWNKVCSHTKGLATLFDDVEVKPSCLHGDLWSGNINYSDGEPTIYDPATYYGHHEAEWGMSWCAGFGSDFWEGYRELIPEDKNFKKRRDLYELYHKLNHYNLFGSGYYSDSVSLMERLLK